MKSRLLSLFTLMMLLTFFPAETKANHAAGGEIVYEWIQDSTYRVFFKFYRDCSGPAAPVNPPPTLCYYSSCNTGPSGSFTAPMGLWGQIPPGVPNGRPVTLGCSGSSTECGNPDDPTVPPNMNIPGVEEWWYFAIVELPWRCDFWTFSADIQVRNQSNNLVGMPNFYVETTYNNLYGQGIDPVTGKTFGNSSPYFDAKPIPYTCQGMPMSFNNDARDPNSADSLVTEIILPLTGVCGGTPTAMTLNNTGATFPLLTVPGNPFQTNNTFMLNAATGQMNFTATNVGAQTLAVKVKEYRNGVLLGSIIRDVQIQVLDPTLCNYTPSTFTSGISIDSAILSGGQIQACQDQQMKFCFDIATADPEGVLFIKDNSKTANQLAGMTVTYTGQGGKAVQGCVTWKPGFNQIGLRNLLITVKDSTCHPPGIVFTQTFSIPIFVHPPVKAFKDSSLCPGDQLVLNAQGGGNYEWVEIGGGSTPTLSCINCPNPTATPFSSLRYAVISNATSFCKHNKDTIDITMLPIPLFDKQGDHTVCPGNAVIYNLNVQTPAGETTTVTWNPTTYLNAPGLQNPVSNPLDDVTYYIEIKNSGNRCKGFDTSKITVLDGFAIETPDTAICLGEAVNVRAIGDPAYTYSWETETQAVGIISDPAILNPTITPGEARRITYKLIAKRPGCRDSIAMVTIDAQPYPTVVVNDDFTICYGDTFRLSSTITPAFDRYKFSWTPGATLDDASVRNPVFSAFTDDLTMQLEVSTPAGCKGSDEVKIEVLPSDFLVLSEDDVICPGETADIKLTGTNVVKMWWDENSPYMDDRMSWNPKVSPVVTHTYKVYGIDNNRCRDTQEVTITVKPAAVISLPDTIRLYPGEDFRMAPKGNALHYSWFPHVGLSRTDISNPLVRPSVNTRYFVTATTEAGCMIKDSVDVLVQPDSYLEVPNIFAPGRGSNGLFKVLRMGDATLTKFTVYNRWGTKMFETSDINEGWDGRFNSQAQPMGVYMYTIQGKTAAGRPFNKQGNVTMLR